MDFKPRKQLWLEAALKRLYERKRIFQIVEEVKGTPIQLPQIHEQTTPIQTTEINEKTPIQLPEINEKTPIGMPEITITSTPIETSEINEIRTPISSPQISDISSISSSQTSEIRTPTASSQISDIFSISSPQTSEIRTPTASPQISEKRTPIYTPQLYAYNVSKRRAKSDSEKFSNKKHKRTLKKNVDEISAKYEHLKREEFWEFVDNFFNSKSFHPKSKRGFFNAMKIPTTINYSLLRSIGHTVTLRSRVVCLTPDEPEDFEIEDILKNEMSILDEKEAANLKIFLKVRKERMRKSADIISREFLEGGLCGKKRKKYKKLEEEDSSS